MSGLLGDFFPDKHKKDFAARSIKQGIVLKCLVDDTTPPKEKRFIIIGTDANKYVVATVYINTEVNENVFRTQRHKDLNIELKESGRDYLQ